MAQGPPGPGLTCCLPPGLCPRQLLLLLAQLPQPLGLVVRLALHTAQLLRNHRQLLLQLGHLRQAGRQGGPAGQGV